MCIACLLLRGEDGQKILANGVKNDSREDDDDFLVHHHGLLGLKDRGKMVIFLL